MIVTREMVADKLAGYLHHEVSLEALVDWAELAMMAGAFQGEKAEEARDVVARLGVPDVRAFGLTWEDCEKFLRKLGYSVHLDVAIEA